MKSVNFNSNDRQKLRNVKYYLNKEKRNGVQQLSQWGDLKIEKI